MREELVRLCQQFIKNRDTVKEASSWGNAYIYPVCAAIFTEKGVEADAPKLRECAAILKEKTGVFSNFRGTAKLAMLSMMATEENPEERLENALKVYGALKEHFSSSQYLPLTSMVIADLVEPEEYNRVAARTRKIYDRMKGEHPFLTSGEDSVFAALLGLSDLSEEQIVLETERCYQILKQEFFSGNAVQSLSHVLALCDGEAKEKCRRTLELYEQLRNRGLKYGREYELATLGVLAMLPVEREQLLSDIADADSFLEGQKGYGVFGIGRKQRLMHAGMLVAGCYVENNTGMMNSAAISGTISLIVAQQAAMCAAVAATSAAAASSN